MRSIHALVLSLLVASAHSRDGEAQHQRLNDLSFGQHGTIWGHSADHNEVPGWDLIGEQGFSPDLLSDRIVLTPPHPGNRRAAAWAKKAAGREQWTAEFDFRVFGQERGSGHLQIWFAKDGRQAIGTSSIYTVGTFDGLALVISQHGGRGGSVRGFLNDGQTSYKDHHHVDRLAFATCDFSYRNLGRFARVTLKQTADFFEVEVDNRSCFKTDKVKLPVDYYFGITAASAEIPDSFEAKSFIVTGSPEAQGGQGHGDKTGTGSSQQHPIGDAHDEHTTPNFDGWSWLTDEKHSINKGPASSFKTEDQRFEDLHNRLSVVSSALDFLYDDLTTLKTQTEKRHEELLRRLDQIQSSLTPTREQVESSRRLMDDVKRELTVIRADVESKDYREVLNQLRDLVRDGHRAVIAGVPRAVNSAMQSTSPRLGFFAFLIIASQFALFISYVIYRRRKESAPKKYL